MATETQTHKITGIVAAVECTNCKGSGYGMDKVSNGSTCVTCQGNGYQVTKVSFRQLAYLIGKAIVEALT